MGVSSTTGLTTGVTTGLSISPDISPLISPAVQPAVKSKTKLDEPPTKPKPPSTKRVRIRKKSEKEKKVDDKYKQANVKGAVAWKQDDVTGVFVIWYPPYNMETLDYGLQVPPGIKRVKTIQAAWRWIHTRGGQVPEESLREVALLAKTSAPSPAGALDNILGGEGKLILK